MHLAVKVGNLHTVECTRRQHKDFGLSFRGLGAPVKVADLRSDIIRAVLG